MKNTVNNYLHILKVNKLIVVILACLLICVSSPLTAVFAEEETQNQVIRVGYLYNYGVVKSPMVKGFEGYGYEYLRKMEEYTDYEFEFVLCEWNEILDKLRLGEIDVVAPFRQTEERTEEFYFTESIFASEVMLLVSSDTTYYSEFDYSHLNNATVGVRDGGGSSYQLFDFMEKYDIDFNIVNIETTNYSKELLKGECDYLLVGSLQMENDLNVAINLGNTNCYFMGTSQEIIENLEYAMNQIQTNEYLYKAELQTKYFNHNIGANQYISNEEYSLIQSRPFYDVGVVSMYPSLGYNYENQLNNISIDVLNFIADKLSINLNLIEITANTTKEEYAELDFYVHLSGYTTTLYENKSNPYMSDTLLLIQNFENNSNNYVGILDYYNLDFDLATTLVNEEDFKYYSTVRSLIDDFNEGEVTSIILSKSVYELYYVLLKSTFHSTKDLHYPLLPAIVFTDDFPLEKIDIINKALTYLTEDDIDRMKLKNMSLITDIEKKHIYEGYGFTILLFLFLAYLIFYINKKNKQKELEKVSNYDRLTGLYTQTKFIKETRDLLNSSSNTKYTLYSFDIDNFKYMNELYGFEVGDEILKTIGNFLKESLDPGEPAARLSSDHFIMLLKTKESIKGDEIYVKLVELLRNNLNDLIGNSYNIEYSVGCYEIEDITLNVELMIDYCNLARSYSKDELGTVVTVYSDLMNQKESIKNDIIFRMNTALRDKEFVLYYQPKFDIVTQEIVGAEALVRWFSDGKMMPPNDFIPLFEKNGFIEKLDYYVIDTACQFIADNSSINIPVISVNLSSVTIIKSDVIEKILDIVNKHSLKPEQIEIEITESAFVDQFETALKRIDNLRLRGFKISMDDFGTGVSSLGRLKNMEIDVLKIDREFIIETLENEKSDVILKNIIQMANMLNLETIAEGIETKEQLEFLRETGCNAGQGYYFARPLPADEFLSLLD